jgi:GH24 family phage-related lysozyme (muramidase)
MNKIKAIRNTFLKKAPVQHAFLTSDRKVFCPVGKSYMVSSHKPAQYGHEQVVLGYGAGTWLIFSEHWQRPWEDDPTDLPEDEIPQAAIDLIKEFEGCHKRVGKDLFEAYPDPLTGNRPWTIGWGSTKYQDGTLVKRGDRLTQAQCDELFEWTLTHDYWNFIKDRIPHWEDLNSNQKGALLSFSYNLGPYFYGSNGFATISKTLKERNYSEMPDVLLLYRNPGSSVEAGLRRRRIAEGKLWSKPA